MGFVPRTQIQGSRLAISPARTSRGSRSASRSTTSVASPGSNRSMPRHFMDGYEPEQRFRLVEEAAGLVNIPRRTSA